MSSESPGRVEPASPGRCLFCSLGCPLQLEQFAPQRWRPVLAGHGQGRLCARGQMVADLLHQPGRIYRPRGRSGPVVLDTAIREMVGHLRREGTGIGRLLVWLDGNVAVEDLAAAHRFCSRWDDIARLLVHLPLYEMGAVEGLDAAEVPQTDPRNWKDADAFLVVGNPLTTHPPVAPHLLRWGKGRTGTPVVVIDSVAGVSGNYTPHRLVCRPGYEYWVVAALLASAGLEEKTDWLPKSALLQRVVKDSGVELESLSRAARQLRSGHRPAVIVAPASGGADRWRALVAISAGWAKQQNGMVSVLTGSANALAVSRYARRHGIDSWGCQEDAEAGIDLLLVVGWDPSSSYPSACWRGVAERAKHVVLVSAFPPADADWVDQIVPLAMNSEVGGTYILADGRFGRVNRVMSPPPGVPSIRELFAMLGQQLSGPEGGKPILEPARVSEADVAAAPMTSGALAPAPPVADEADGRPAVLVADPIQYMDGQTTRHSRWSQQFGLLPELWVSPRDAAGFGLEDGVTARIKNDQGAVQVRVVVARDQPDFGGCSAEAAPQGGPAGWWAVSGGFAEIRRLASWRFDVPNASALAGTINVSLEPV